jgi:hypothetical protein
MTLQKLNLPAHPGSQTAELPLRKFVKNKLANKWTQFDRKIGDLSSKN